MFVADTAPYHNVEANFSNSSTQDKSKDGCAVSNHIAIHAPAMTQFLFEALSIACRLQVLRFLLELSSSPNHASIDSLELTEH